MHNVLVVGENPYSITGNAKMTRYILTTLDVGRYAVHVFSVDAGLIDPLRALERPFPFPVTSSLSPGARDPYGKQKLLDILTHKPIDAVIFVGFDIWRYADIFPHIRKIQQNRRFQWVVLFPYDLQEIREDWLEWIRMPDTPLVYSMDGYNRLIQHVPHLAYFRPAPSEPNHFAPMSREGRMAARHRWFPSMYDDAFVFGFVGANQMRKAPLDLIRAFALLLSNLEHTDADADVRLCMFTEKKNGTYNLAQYAKDCGIAEGKVFFRPEGLQAAEQQMAEIYNTLDCLVNCTVQEGLSWTVIEAMMCGVPVIASQSTAHVELLNDTANMLVPVGLPMRLPVPTAQGDGWVDAMGCKPDMIWRHMKMVFRDSRRREQMAETGLEKITQWAEGKSDINEFLTPENQCTVQAGTAPREAICFAQHSSAGDILMTTKALAGLKKRHPGMPLVYMTLARYHDILEGNPYIDEIIGWDQSLMENRYRYRHFYAPHSDTVLPGGWGRNCNALLSDFYWQLVDVEKGAFFIEPVCPDCWERLYEKMDKPILVVHTTGGDPDMRTYKYMPDVCREFRNQYTTVQLGGPNDFPAGADLDLRHLTYREAAWVMSHARFAVTVDSFISHLAGALGVSQVTLFGCSNARVVRPDQVDGNLVCMSPDYIRDCPVLGPCSGSVKKCAVRCTGHHDPRDIIETIAALAAWEKEGVNGRVVM